MYSIYIYVQLHTDKSVKKPEIVLCIGAKKKVLSCVSTDFNQTNNLKNVVGEGVKKKRNKFKQR